MLQASIAHLWRRDSHGQPRRLVLLQGNTRFNEKVRGRTDRVG